MHILVGYKGLLVIVCLFMALNLAAVIGTLFVDTGGTVIYEYDLRTVEVPYLVTRDVPVIHTSVVVRSITRHYTVTPYGWCACTPTPEPVPSPTVETSGRVEVGQDE